MSCSSKTILTSLRRLSSASRSLVPALPRGHVVRSLSGVAGSKGAAASAHGAVQIQDHANKGLDDGAMQLQQQQKMVEKLTIPQEALAFLNEVGLKRGERPAEQIFWSSVLGGAYISWGASMYFTFAGGSASALSAAAGAGFHKIVTAAIFPIGLTAITITGTDMVTSNMMFSSLPIVSQDQRRSMEEKVASLARLWGISTLGNFVGCFGMAYCASHLISASPEAAAFTMALAVKKTSLPLHVAFAKAVGCNWLVNLAIFQAQTAPTTPGKMAVLWLPITTFVALGLEHFVANMYIIPLGMFLGADIPVSSVVFNNFIPVFAGNAVGASFFVSFLMWKSIMTGVKQPFTKT